MTKDLVIIALGFWVALLPFLGFPNSWDRIILLASGFSIAILMYLLRRDFFAYVDHLRRRKDFKQQTDSYVEKDPRAEIVTPEPNMAVPFEAPPSEVIEPVSDYVAPKPSKRVRSQSV